MSQIQFHHKGPQDTEKRRILHTILGVLGFLGALGGKVFCCFNRKGYSTSGVKKARACRRPSLLALILLCALALQACSADEPRIAFDSLDFSLADAGSGQKLFNQSNNDAPACSACHMITGESSGIGNSLAAIGALAGGRVAGQSAEEYLFWSILRPGQHLVAGYSNIMYAGYEDSLEAADIADLIAYLLILR